MERSWMVVVKIARLLAFLSESLTSFLKVEPFRIQKFLARLNTGECRTIDCGCSLQISLAPMQLREDPHDPPPPPFTFDDLEEEVDTDSDSSPGKTTSS